jgi:tRNA U55 pseudouridine synthase TruB
MDDIRAAAADGADRLAALLLPIDAGLDALPELLATDPEVEALSRGQFIRPSSLASEAPGDGPIRVRDGAGRLVAIVTLRDGRLVPDKVLVDPHRLEVTADA